MTGFAEYYSERCQLTQILNNKIWWLSRNVIVTLAWFTYWCYFSDVIVIKYFK